MKKKMKKKNEKKNENMKRKRPGTKGVKSKTADQEKRHSEELR